MSEAPAVAIRAALRRTLEEYAVDVSENQGLHDWRCKYPDRYPGRCGHFDQLLDALVAAMLRLPAGVIE